MIYVLIIISVTLLIFLTRYKYGIIVYLRKLTLPAAGILVIVCLLIFSDTAVKSAAKGINLWLNIVFPSLFPFFVISDILNGTGFVRAVGILFEPIMRPLFNVPGCSSFAFLMGITSGYPVGAKITSSLRKDKLISKTEAERLLAFSNNSGPLFIIGSVSVGMFKMPELGLFLLTCHILACITVGILFRFYKKKAETERCYYSRKNLIYNFKKEFLNTKKQNIGTILGDAVKNSVSVILAIGGFIIFFSVLINLLIDVKIIGLLSEFGAAIFIHLGIHKDIITSVISGFFEITTGTNTASQAVNAPFIQQLTAASLIIGWAGLSVHSQVVSIVSKTDISIRPYLLGKLLQGIIAAVYTYCALKIPGNFFAKIKPAFASIHQRIGLNWYDYFFNSCRYALISIGVVFIAMFVSLLFHTKDKRS